MCRNLNIFDVVLNYISIILSGSIVEGKEWNELCKQMKNSVLMRMRISFIYFNLLTSKMSRCINLINLRKVCFTINING